MHNTKCKKSVTNYGEGGGGYNTGGGGGGQVKFYPYEKGGQKTFKDRLL